MRNSRGNHDVGRTEGDFMDLMADSRRGNETRSSSEQAIRTIYVVLVPLVFGAMVLIPMASVKTSQVWTEVSLMADELEKAAVVMEQERFLDDVRNTASTNDMRTKIDEGRRLGMFDKVEGDLFQGQSKAEVIENLAAIRLAIRTGDYTLIPPEFAKRARELLGATGVKALKRRLKGMSGSAAEELVLSELSKQGITVAEDDYATGG